MSIDFDVRDYHPADLERVVRLFTASVHGLAATRYDEAQRAAWAPRDPDPERFRERFAAQCLLLAERDGDLLGFIGFERDGHVDFLYTAPECARQGVARQLHDAAVERLAALGVTALHTEASEVARPFFERVGYRVVEREEVERDGVRLPRYRMRRA